MVCQNRFWIGLVVGLIISIGLWAIVFLLRWLIR